MRVPSGLNEPIIARVPNNESEPIGGSVPPALSESNMIAPR
jgi:hypothetical protein